jgi:hypothetical protein
MGDLGPLAAALAKAQTQFPAITRDKHVTVRTKDGGSYSFDYAPLDTIIAAVRGPLAANGLAVAQVLDEGDLITMLMHESGVVLSGRVSLPAADNIQGLGSAITYLRRYALQAVLGIAAEEDDDGNHAIGGSIAPRLEPAPVPGEETLVPKGHRSVSGRVARGQGRHSDLQARMTPNGHHIGFRLELPDGKPAIAQVVATDALGTELLAHLDDLLGSEVQVSGEVFEVQYPGRRSYYRLVLDGIAGPDWVIPGPDAAPVVGGLSAAEQASLDGLAF